VSVFISVEQEVPHKSYRYCIETIFFLPPGFNSEES